MTELPVRRLEPNPWNPNRMPEDLYQALKTHMQKGGKVDPLIVTPKLVPPITPPIYSYVIVDGEHRWRAATELGWETLPCEVMTLTEDEAKREGYQRNKFRGTMDVYREAELFQSIVQSLGSQEKCAEFFGVSQALVARRLSILKTDTVVRELYKVNMPRGIITPSHLESIATLPEKRQVEVAGEVVDDGLSVQATERRVQQEKRILEQKENLRKAVEASQHKTCPECGADIEGATFEGLPWVRCKGKKDTWQRHEWNLDTGQTEKQYREAQRRKERASKPEEGEEEPKPRQPPQSFRYPAAPDDIGKKVTKRVLSLMRDVTVIETLRLTGRLGDQEVSIDFTAPHKAKWTGTENLSYSERVGSYEKGAKEVTFFMEAKEYKTFPEKSLVSGHIEPVATAGTKDEYDRAVKVLEHLRKWLDEL